MKTILLSLIMLSGAGAYAFEANCKVTEMYDESFLEESLSIEEYPEVTLGLEEVYLGASRYSVDDGDVIKLLPTVGFHKSLEIRVGGSDELIFWVQINRSPGNKSGTVYGQNKGEERSKIADLICE